MPKKYEEKQSEYISKDFERKSFAQLGKEKAGCLEYAMNGYIRLYEIGEKKCECKNCILSKQFPM